MRVVVCAAIMLKRTGEIICGPRHYDKLIRSQILIKSEEEQEEWFSSDKIIQGFVDQQGVFLNRQDALVVAKAANQIRRRCGGDDIALYSENLY